MTDLDMSLPHNRLRWARERAGFKTKEDFALAAKVKPVTYRAHETGQNGFLREASNYAKVANVSVDWLINGGNMPTADEPSLGEAGTPADLESYGIEIVRLVDIRYAMGDGAIIEDYPETGFMPFERQMLRKFARGPVDSLFIAIGQGDSMEPTLRRDDWVMIDASQRRLTEQDHIWAISYAGTGMIKRLRRISGGKLSILSDNPLVPPNEVDEDEVHIVGKVVWSARFM